LQLIRLTAVTTKCNETQLVDPSVEIIKHAKLFTFCGERYCRFFSDAYHRIYFNRKCND